MMRALVEAGVGGNAGQQPGPHLEAHPFLSFKLMLGRQQFGIRLQRPRERALKRPRQITAGRRDRIGRSTRGLAEARGGHRPHDHEAQDNRQPAKIESEHQQHTFRPKTRGFRFASSLPGRSARRVVGSQGEQEVNSMEAKNRNVRPRWHHGNDYLCVRCEGKKGSGKRPFEVGQGRQTRGDRRSISILRNRIQIMPRRHARHPGTGQLNFVCYPSTRGEFIAILI